MTGLTNIDEGERQSSDINALLFHKGKVYSGDNDGTIKVWDPALKLLTSLDDAHTKRVTSLAATDEILYSGSEDGCIKAWNLDSLTLKGSLDKGNRKILKLGCDNDNLYVGDNKGKVEMYYQGRFITDEYLDGPIKDMVILDNLILTSEKEYLIVRLIRSQYGNFERRKTMLGQTPICVADDKLLFCSEDGRGIHLRENSLDTNFKDISLTEKAHDKRLLALLGVVKGKDISIYSGGADKVVKKWKIRENTLVQVCHCPVKEEVNVLIEGCNGEVYVGCKDGFMYCLDF